MLMRSVLSLCCLSFFSCSLTVFSASAADGVIHFRGSIVEEGCDFSHSQRQFRVVCPVGTKRVTQTFAVADINSAKIKSNVPASVQLHYLDERKKLAVINVVYH
ncbi:type 1 fimbrial protein [Atlantibacter subterraneus]|uniref:type 1 fimbrial protein n=1 Tax=Atlantibacter subterraneus TaxID=255519 RepID=UPI002FDDA46C